MIYSINYRFFAATKLCSAFILILFMLTSCSSQTKLGSDYPSLSSINKEPSGHYQTLAQYSKSKSDKDLVIDNIRFPDKKFNIVIKTISPAYLDRDEVERLALDMLPPANSSEQTRAELDFLLDLQESRTKEQIDEALRMHDVFYFPIIGMKDEDALFFEVYEIFGYDFDITKLKETKNLLHNVMKEMRITEFTAKNHFLRARPRQLESKLTPLKKMTTSSFASGHTLWAYMQAYVLAELIPEKKDEFLDLAYRIAFSREVLGVHYPSDEEEARKLSHRLISKMWEKPTFKEDFLRAREEWKNIE